MFKKFIPLALALSMLIPTIAAAETIAKKANSAKAPYSTEIATNKQTIKTNRVTNQALQASIKEKTAQIKVLLTESKGNKTLKLKKDALKLQKSAVKSAKDNLKAINANLKTASTKAKADKAAKDFESLLTDLKSIPNLQSTKTPILQKINSDLDLIITTLTDSSL